MKKNKQHLSSERISFDDYTETYQKEIESSIGFIGQESEFFLHLKAVKLLELAEKYLNNVKNIKVLDVGSGVGLMDELLKDKFGNLYGVDVEQGVVKKAAETNPSVNYKVYDGLKFPFSDNEMDYVFAVNVMHHVIPERWSNFMKEMHRVTRKGGLAAVFEHNPYNPLTRLVVGRCEFDRDAVLLKKKNLKRLFSNAGFEIAESSYIIFFPFRNKIFRETEKIIGWLPMGAQYYTAGIKS